jgi:nickel transport protein
MPDVRRPPVFVPVVLFVALAGALPTTLGAHGVRVFAAVEGDSIQGRAEFVAGGPVTGARVEVFAPSGKSLGSTTTDGSGRFTFTPTEAVDHRFWVHDGSGHAAEHTVAKAELPASVLRSAGQPQNPGADEDVAATVEAAVSKHVSPLRDEIDELRRSIRLHDILGGIGYIAGLTGLWFYLKARRTCRE